MTTSIRDDVPPADDDWRPEHRAKAQAVRDATRLYLVEDGLDVEPGQHEHDSRVGSWCLRVGRREGGRRFVHVGRDGHFRPDEGGWTIYSAHRWDDTRGPCDWDWPALLDEVTDLLYGKAASGALPARDGEPGSS